MCEYMHARAVEVAEPRRACTMLPLDEVLGGGEKLFVNGLHSLGVQRPGVLDDLFGITLLP
jgi:hypothetical protein